MKEPNERVIDLLAELKMKAGDLGEAEKLYELARKDDPAHTKWIAGLARVHLRQKKTTQFLNDLAMIAANDADDIAVRKALAERHLAAGDAAAAERWANESLYIDVYDPSVHLLLADSQALGNKYDSAIEEYQTALGLKPKKPNDLKVKLAQAQLAAGKRDAARSTVDAVLKADPEHPEAKALLEKIDRAASG
jgi:predicted Zn-dependent protease